MVIAVDIERERRVAPWLEDGTRIPALPAAIQEVPTDPQEWTRWSRAALHFRREIRMRAETNADLQRHLIAASAADPAFFLVVFGSIYEPRWKGGHPPGWRPWMLYAFQVETIRVIQDILKIRSGPERHLLIEKSRDMGATWLCCAMAAHAWLYAPAVEIAMTSREASLVDERGDHNSMFFKVRGVLGIEETTPEDQRLPEWLFPTGFRAAHDKTMQISHPSRPNQIKGETTTRNSGRAKRGSWRINDEAAFNRYYGAAKAGQFNTTDHIISPSSAGLDDGGVFKGECDHARENRHNPHVRTQTLLQLPYYVHPLHDQEWYNETKAEMDRVDPYAFSREVLMNYTAGQGNRVYPMAQDIATKKFPYEAGAGPVIVAIDPGLSDETAILFVQYRTRQKRWRVFHAFQMKNATARFIAAVLVGRPPSEGTRTTYEQVLSAQATMRIILGIKDPITYVGDPYGAHRGGDGEMSFYDRMSAVSAELTGNQHVIHVISSYEKEKLEYRPRREAVQHLLPRIDWNDTPEVSYALECIKDAAYPDSTNRAVKEPDKPRHDRTSHYRSALEFFAVHQELDEGIGELDRSVEIVNLGGDAYDPRTPVFARDLDRYTDDIPDRVAHSSRYRDDRTLFEE